MLSVRKVVPCEGYVIALEFSDGAQGTVDLSTIPHKGLFKAWDDRDFFRAVSVQADSGTVVWPNGADLDPYVLYSKALRMPMEDVLNRWL